VERVTPLSTRTTDVVVVGGGVMGLASAWAVDRSGREVLVLEQFEVGHPHGSSHSVARIFRFAYSEPEWVAFAQEALPLWRELEAQTGLELLSLTGLLDLSSDSGPLRAALDERKAEYEMLDADEVASRFGMTVSGEVVLELHGGTVRADRALAAFRAGVSVEEGLRVHRLADTGDGVRLETSAGPIEARIAVVAAGAWATPLLATADIPLATRVTRETVAYFDLQGAERLPSVIDWHEQMGRHAYSLASGDGMLKVGLHHSGTQVEPGGVGEPDTAIVEAIAGWVDSRYPSANPSPTGAETCLYTSITDDRFVIERHGSIVVCSACSGHGFKFAPAVGTRAAALA
jgi:sarcosine oxidase